MKSIFSLRKLGKAEAPEMLQLFFNTITLVNSKDYSTRQTTAWKSSGSLDKIYELLKEHKFFGIFIENTLAGFCSLNDEGFIHSFFVSANHQKIGAGKFMMQSLLELALEKQVPQLSAEVSITAKPFFEKMGFTVSTPQVVFIGDVALRNFRMTKEIKKGMKPKNTSPSTLN